MSYLDKLNDKSLLRTHAFVGGAWLSAEEPDATLSVVNPSTGSVIGTVPDMRALETRRAIAAAHTALPAWRDRTAKERSTILRRWSELMMQNQNDLATIMTSEQGKTLAESRAEIAYAASYLEWFAEEAKRIYGDTIPSQQSDRRIVILKQPIGVCAAITPWNFPAAMITRKAGPALAVGCTMVVKPASQTPFSALALAVLAERAGLPEGVFSVITGSASAIGGEMTSNPLVRKLSFTGSTDIGKRLMAQCSGTMKRTSMELGGNAPFIVFDDADLEEAVRGAIASKYRNAGQTCVCVNRILAQDGIYDAFVARLADAVRGLKVGDGFAEGIHVGPLVNNAAIEKTQEHITDAVSKGAKVVVGGRPHVQGQNFYEPTVLRDATRDMKIFTEETFGPVAAVFRFKTDLEAINLANDTQFGLASYFYSRDIGRIWRVAEALEYGMVGINEGLISSEVAPFGGVKESGNGREGSKYGVEDYLEIKYLCMGGLAPIGAG
ncbi:NAD-dependent succinate-semialdehyde dehydrogenase [Bradyrhizobium canariense]|uniref:NAD-dependent succinate-semialdehyde dehydrogenase n=1 Tax=Bradyrhizobium canariense TaxID=255045 RepID=UPI00202D8112|nr:NAD-dependent succinate-semialdehyde dehydrogenase [Bradyrhizobium canariense]MBW5435757.1 NAD-dependent succinate-semialdehyde dehydrogenase [Bradyrhizobium canariense]